MSSHHDTKDLEKLFQDARKVRKDRERSERLTRLVDELAEAEKGEARSNRHIFPWRWIGIAASLLIVGLFGIRFLYNTTTSSDSANHTAQNHSVDRSSRITSSSPIILDTMQSISEQKFMQQTLYNPEGEASDAARTSDTEMFLPVLMSTDGGALILAENRPDTSIRSNPIACPENDTMVLADNRPQIFERKSRKLVGTKPQPMPENNTKWWRRSDKQSFALLATGSTETEITIGSIKF